jgi:hypothetical protein
MMREKYFEGEEEVGKSGSREVRKSGRKVVLGESPRVRKVRKSGRNAVLGESPEVGFATTSRLSNFLAFQLSDFRTFGLPNSINTVLL